MNELSTFATPGESGFALALAVSIRAQHAKHVLAIKPLIARANALVVESGAH